MSDPIDIAIKKFENHPSIITIKENISSVDFNFLETNLEEISKEIKNLNPKKKGTFNDIPSNLLQETSKICAPFLVNIWNDEIINKKIFPGNLKLADVTPVFKKENATLTKNYRPVSVLPTVSKVFERLMQKQITSFIDKFLSPFLCGYRKGYNTQTALVSLIEKWRQQLDKKGFTGAVLMDLSKAFDTINHELLIAKLYAYGFSKNAVQLIHSYLTNRRQRVKVNTAFSSWTELLQGVPQGSVLGPLLFNIYLNDLFFILKDIEVCNFADDTTPYVCDKSLEKVLCDLEKNSELVISWCLSNYMKLNTEKCHLLISGYKHEHTWVKLPNGNISKREKISLGKVVK